MIPMQNLRYSKGDTVIKYYTDSGRYMGWTRLKNHALEIDSWIWSGNTIKIGKVG